MESVASRVRILQGVTDTALAHLRLDDLLRELLGRVREALAADTVVILIVSEDDEELQVRAALGLEEEVARAIRVPLGRGFAGRGSGFFSRRFRRGRRGRPQGEGEDAADAALVARNHRGRAEVVLVRSVEASELHDQGGGPRSLEVVEPGPTLDDSVRAGIRFERGVVYDDGGRAAVLGKLHSTDCALTRRRTGHEVGVKGQREELDEVLLQRV